MYFDSFEQAMHMGGHGGYVWSTYAIFVLVMTALVVFCYRQLSRSKRKSRLLEQTATKADSNSR